MESKESYFYLENGRIIYNDLDNLSQMLNGEFSITNYIKDKFFEFRKILGDGNCLFNAISYMLINKYKFPKDENSPDELRKELYNFYQSYDYTRIKEGRFENDFEQRFYISTLPAAGDAEDDYIQDNRGIYFRHKVFPGLYNTLQEIGNRQADYMMKRRYRRIDHTENIINDRVFGSNGDTIALSYIKNINIVVIIEDRFVNRETPQYYRVDPYIRNNNNECIYLLLRGDSHYDILMPRNEPFDRLDGLSSPTTSSNYTRKSNSLKDNQTRKKSPPRNNPVTQQDYTRKSNSLKDNQTRKKSPPRNNPVTQQDLQKSMNLLEKLLAKQQDLQELIKGYEQLLVELNDTSDIEQVINAIEKQREKLVKIENKINDKLNNLFEIHKKLQQPMNELKTLFETHDRLRESIREKQNLLDTTRNKARESRVNNEVTQLKSEMNQIETQIHKIIGTEFSLYVALSELVARFLAKIKIW